MTKRPEPLPVLLVGTIHLANPGRDMANVAVEDVLAPGRQAELEELAVRLAGFGPTKVAVEAPYGDDAVHHRYAEYRRTGQLPGRSEVDQIGFRVAARMGHSTVWPADVEDVFFDPEVERVAAADARLASLYEGLQRAAQQLAARQQDWLATSTIGATLARANRPGALHEALALYVRYLAPIADPPSYPGPDMVAAWYRRNLRILAHLEAVCASEDRLLVLFGHGHVAALCHLLALSDRFELVDPEPYLDEP